MSSICQPTGCVDLLLTRLHALVCSRKSSEHYLDLDARVVLGLTAFVLCVVWSALARTASRDFSWRQRASLALHAQGAQEKARQRQGIVNSLFVLLKLVATCIVLGAGLIVSHAVRCSKVRTEVTAAGGVLGVHAAALLALYSLIYSVRYTRSRRRPLALAASGLPCVSYLLFVTLRIRQRGCRAAGNQSDDEGSSELTFMSNLQVAVSLCAVVFQALLLCQTVVIVRYRTARERELLGSREDVQQSTLPTSVQAGTAMDATSTSNRRALRILGADAALPMPLPPQYSTLDPRVESAVRATMRGREMLLHMPSKRFSEKRFMQLDLVLNTLRWSWKDYIGLDQIEVTRVDSETPT